MVNYILVNPYRLQLWGSPKPSNTYRIQTFQSKVLHKIVNAPFYASKKTLHNNFNTPCIRDLAKTWFQIFYSQLDFYSNPEGLSLSSQFHPDNPPFLCSLKESDPVDKLFHFHWIISQVIYQQWLTPSKCFVIIIPFFSLLCNNIM